MRWPQVGRAAIVARRAERAPDGGMWAVARLLDRVVVIDVESTCWPGSPPAGEQAEIIEVGVCTLDVAALEPVDREAILVRPVGSTVSDFCTRLTTLTQQQVDGGIAFAEACRRLKRTYRGTERLWASWGDYDRRQFERQCAASGVGYPFGPSHLNVKALFAVVLGLPHEVGMDEALPLVGLGLAGTHHRGVDDAYNIARILAVLLRAARPARP